MARRSFRTETSHGQTEHFELEKGKIYNATVNLCFFFPRIERNFLSFQRIISEISVDKTPPI